MPLDRKKTKPGYKGKKETPVESKSDAIPMRIAKHMARAGTCSRREAERWIEAGRVSVNGQVLTTPATIVTMADHIVVDGEPLNAIERTRLWMYNKPSGLVTTNNDPEGRPTVFEKLPPELPRVLSIGRLDINTEGLLLLTNDGGLARSLELPSTGWLRRYRVRAYGKVTQDQLDTLKDGIAVEGVLYGAIDAQLERQQGTNAWLTFAMREGKNREVKKVLATLNLDVNRLIRLSYGPFQLGDIKSGQAHEVRGRTLRDQLGDKLISESGANFDAPLHDRVEKKEAEISKSKPEKNDWKKESSKDSGERNRDEQKQSTRRNFKRPDFKNVDPLSRLDTKPQQNRNGKKSGASTKRPTKGRPGADRRR